MLFKKPKTTLNFILGKEFWVPFLDSKWRIAPEIDDTDRKESIWSGCWEGIIRDPIYFWYLMIIFEIYSGADSEQEINLNHFTRLPKYGEIIEKVDVDLYYEGDAENLDVYQGCYDSMVILRILWLTAGFYAFDIRNISLNESINTILQKVLEKTIIRFRERIPSKWEIEELSLQIEELCGLDDENSIKGYNRELAQYNDKDRIFLGDDDFYDIYPFENDKGRIADIWEKIALFGEHIKIRFEFDKENMHKLSDLIEKTVDQMVGDQTSTHWFIKIAKQCEKIGSTLYIPFEKLLTPNFPLLQYIYGLEKTDGCSITSWAIEDDWIVTIYDETIADALGMSREKKKAEASKQVTYNFDKEVLCLDGKPLSLWDVNDVFIQMFFDLEKSGMVSIDELAESIDPIVADMSKDARWKAEKSFVYDRVPAINRKLNKELWIEKFFTIENRKVKLSYREILENSPKKSRKK